MADASSSDTAAPSAKFTIPIPAATFPNFVPGYDGGYANLGAQIQDALGMASRYSNASTWGNGAGRYAYGSGAPYGDPSGRNAPWYVTGANGAAGHYPNPGTILGQGVSTIPAGQPGAYTGGLLGAPKDNRVAVDNFPQAGLLARANPETTQQELASLPQQGGNVIANGAMQPGNLTAQQMQGMKPADYSSLWDSLGAVGRYNLITGNSQAAQSLLGSGKINSGTISDYFNNPLGSQ
jgi:hypothetical protein